MHLFELLKNVISELELKKIPYALCGGLAMAVHAFSRATIDIDIIIKEKDLEKTKGIARKLGFTLDQGFLEFKKGEIRIYRLTKIDTDIKDAIPLDLLIVTPKLKNIWETRENITCEFGTVSVVSREGLIKLKSMRGSGQDMDDIRKLKDEMEDEA